MGYSLPVSSLAPLSSACARSLAEAFRLLGTPLSLIPHGSGHINDTFALRMDQAGTPVRYLLQRINEAIFTDVPALMDNIHRVTTHLAGPPRSALQLVSTKEGSTWHRDADRCPWRCYLFIEHASTHDLIHTPSQARTAAEAFGLFMRRLADLPGAPLHEVIRGFHDTRARVAQLKAAAESPAVGRLDSCREELIFALSRSDLAEMLPRLQAAGEIPLRVTHNDTKLNNVMLDDASGEAVCIVDLDTIMPGFAPNDFGDMVRTATSSTAEDEADIGKIHARPEIFTALAEGYLAGAGAVLVPAEIAHLEFAGRLMTYEVGIRFLADYLRGDTYFKIKHPGHNLERARNQFALLRSLEAQSETFAAILQSLHHPTVRQV